VSAAYGDGKRKLKLEEMCHPLIPFDVNLVMEPAAIVEGTVMFDENLLKPGEPAPYPSNVYLKLNDAAGKDWTYNIYPRAIDEQGRFQIDAPPSDWKYKIEMPIPTNWRNDNNPTEATTEPFVLSQPGSHRIVIRWSQAEQNGVIVRKAMVDPNPEL